MTSVRPDLDPNEDDKHTYPTVINGRTIEMIVSQRRRLKEHALTLEQRIHRLERTIERMGIKLDDVYW